MTNPTSFVSPLQKTYKNPVKIFITVSMNLSSVVPSKLQDIFIIEGDSIGLGGQKNPTENGIYWVRKGKLRRRMDVDRSKEIASGFIFSVDKGYNAEKVFQFEANPNFVLNKTSIILVEKFKKTQSVELISTKILQVEVQQNDETTFKTILKEAILADKNANYWFDCYLEIESDTTNKEILIQLKNGSVILSESFTNIEIIDIPKIFNVQSKNILIEKEFPVSFEILFKLNTAGGIAIIKNARLTIYRQQI